MSEDPFFFIGDRSTEHCSWDGQDIYSGGMSKHGSLCAYISEINHVYSCPAPDVICWTYSVFGDQTKQPTDVSSLTTCSLTNSTGSEIYWQCNAKYEKCPPPGQTNNCLSQFDNPLKNIADSAANAIASSVVASVSQTSSTSATSSTTIIKSISTPTSSQTGITSSSSPHAQTITSGGTASSATSSNVIIETAIPRGLSSSAIAGIAVSSVLGSILLTVLGLILWRRRAGRKVSQHCVNMESQRSVNMEPTMRSPLSTTEDGMYKGEFGPSYFPPAELCPRDAHQLPGSDYVAELPSAMYVQNGRP